MGILVVGRMPWCNLIRVRRGRRDGAWTGRGRQGAADWGLNRFDLISGLRIQSEL